MENTLWSWKILLGYKLVSRWIRDDNRKTLRDIELTEETRIYVLGVENYK